MAAKVITVAQQKGGAGKTTLVAQLAVAFAQMGRRVALVDIDPQGSLAAWFRVRCDGSHPGAAALHVSEVSGWRTAGEVATLKNSHDLVIIDSPPHAETEAKVAVRAADLVVIPIQPSPMDVWATAPTVKLAESENVPAILVLNRVPPRGRIVETMRQRLAGDGLTVATTALGNRIAFAASMLEGRTVLEQAPRSTGAAEVRALADDIAARL
jgi:chromosome partitioning protein